MNTVARIKKDYELYVAEAPEGIFLEIDDDDIFKMHAVVVGLQPGVYEGVFFYFKIEFSGTYPIKPPKITHISNAHIRLHPHFSKSGDVCLSVLREDWSPSINIMGILLSIQCLLDNDAADLVNNSAKRLYSECHKYGIGYNLKNMANKNLKEKITEYFNKNLDKYKNFIMHK
jgi:ubiquitin-protein ligase